MQEMLGQYKVPSRVILDSAVGYVISSFFFLGNPLLPTAVNWQIFFFQIHYGEGGYCDCGSRWSI